jgi:hypothetical protein
MTNKTYTRLCRSCKIDKPLEEYYTYSDGRTKDGRRAKCIQCMTNGRPPGPVPMNPLTRYVIDDKGCWIWSGAVHKSGYGQIKWKGKSTVAHRVIYELIKGEIPTGLIIDHLCNVKLCVNPDHLEAVNYSLNTQRAWDRRHCATCTCNQ